MKLFPGHFDTLGHFESEWHGILTLSIIEALRLSQSTTGRQPETDEHDKTGHETMSTAAPATTTATTRRIEIFIVTEGDQSGWMAEDNDPQTLELFGTNTLPLPFLAAAPAANVIESLRELNPGAEITVRGTLANNASREGEKAAKTTNTSAAPGSARFEIIEQTIFDGTPHEQTHFRTRRCDGFTIEGSHQIDFETLEDALNCVEGYTRRRQTRPALATIYKVDFQAAGLRRLVNVVEFE